MNKNLIILVSHLSFFISHRLQIAIAAKNEGYNVKLVVGELDADKKKVLEKGIDIFHLPIKRGGINPLREIISFLSLWFLFKRLKPDIVHLVTIKSYLYGGIISRLTRVPSVISAISGLGSVFVPTNLLSKIFRFILYPIYQLALNHPNQIVIVQNKEDANLLIKWGVLQSKKVRLFRGSGVDINDFKKLEEPDGTPTVCFAARLIRDKGVFEFVNAARILNNKGLKVNFLLAGDLDLSNPTSLRNKDIKNLKNERVVEVLGYQKNIANLYANSHIVCLPSYREGLPKSLLEAAAASRVVVTTDVPGCRDAIIPNKSGILVPVKNSLKLADAIQYLIENPKRRIEMGKIGRLLAKKQFNLETITKKHLDLYKELSN